MILDDFVGEFDIFFKVALGLPETSPGSIGPPWHIPRSTAMVEIHGNPPFTDHIPTGWAPPSYVCWFITQPKYSYLRIIHQLVIIVMFTNLANELGPHPVGFHFHHGFSTPRHFLVCLVQGEKKQHEHT